MIFHHMQTKSYRLRWRPPNITILRMSPAAATSSSQVNSTHIGPQRAEFRARYLVESSEPIEKTAEVIAGEQSSGTFLSLPGETDELKNRARARVTRIEPLPAATLPSLHSALSERRASGGVFHRGHVEIAFPVLDSDLQAQIHAILEIQLADTVKGRRILATGNSVRTRAGGEPALRSQDRVYDALAHRSGPCAATT